MKKLENFIRKEDEIEYWKSRTTPEDIEYYECQLELQQNLLTSYNRVERIIGSLTYQFVYFNIRFQVVFKKRVKMKMKTKG